MPRQTKHKAQRHPKATRKQRKLSSRKLLFERFEERRMLFCFSDFCSDYGQSRTHNETDEQPATYSFEVDAIAARKNTEWYVNDQYTGPEENDWSGTGPNPEDPTFATFLPAGTTTIEAKVYDRFWNFEENHIWNLTIFAPDLRVRSLVPSDTTVVPGDEIEIDAVIRNYGDADAAQSTVRYYWGPSGGSRQRHIGDGLVPNLGVLSPGEEADDSPTTFPQPDFEIPDVSPGTFYITAIADYFDSVDEGDDEDNNELSIPITVNERPALTQLSWRADGSIDAPVLTSIDHGQTVYVRADATGMERQSIDVEIWEDDELIGDDHITTLSITIGAEGFGTVAWDAVWQAEDGDDPQNQYYAYYDGPLLNNRSSSNLQTVIPDSTAGVTVITHGWQPQFGQISLPPEWTVEMARAVVERAGDGSIFVNDTRPDAITFGEWIALETILDELTGTETPVFDYLPHNWINSNSSSNEIILIYNWAWESNDGEDGWLQAAADNLFASLFNAPLGADILNSMIHFIGHSRGAVLNSLVTNLLGHHFPSFTVDQVTSLDPHPIRTEGSIAGVIYEDDPEIFTYDNVKYADNYFRQDGLYQLDLDFDGVEVPGAWNLELNNYALDEPDIPGLFDEQGSQFEHSDTHIWYLATTNTGGVTIESESVSEYMRTNWWRCGDDIDAAYDCDVEVSGRTNVGFNRSRIGSNDPSRFDLGPNDRRSTSDPEYSIFNGDFSYGDVSPNELPGWERHGGIGDGDLTADGRLHLGEDGIINFTRVQHNPLYFPQWAAGLSFEYEITRASPDDTLSVYVGDHLVDSLSLLSLDTDSRLVPLNSDYQGTINTIELRLDHGGSIQSDIYIDNLTFVSEGDMNFDGVVNQDDAAAFALGLTKPDEYEAMYGLPPSVAGDTDGDGDIDFDDIVGFVALLPQAQPTAISQTEAATKSARQTDEVFAEEGSLETDWKAHKRKRAEVDVISEDLSPRLI